MKMTDVNDYSNRSTASDLVGASFEDVSLGGTVGLTSESDNVCETLLPTVVSDNNMSDLGNKTSVKYIIHKIEHNIHSNNDSLDNSLKGLESNADVMPIDLDEVELSGNDDPEGELPSESFISSDESEGASEFQEAPSGVCSRLPKIAAASLALGTAAYASKRLYGSDNVDDEDGIGIDDGVAPLPFMDSIREALEAATERLKPNRLQSFVSRRMGIETYDTLFPDIISRLESLILTGLAIRESSSTEGVIWILLNFVKQSFNNNESYVMIVNNVIRKCIGFEPQAGLEWVQAFKRLSERWKAIEKSAIFKKVSLVITLCTTITMLRRTETPLTQDGLLSMIKSSQGIHLSAHDMYDAILGTVTHFLERGFLYFRTKDWRVLFVENPTILDFDRDCIQVEGMYPFACVGDYDRYPGMDDDKYVDKLVNLIDRAHQICDSLTNSYEKKIYQAKLASLIHMDQNFCIQRQNSGMREAPLAILIHGRSSVGKSDVVQILTTSLLKIFDLGTLEQRVFINDIDKYDSNVRSNTRCIILDDLGNTHEKFLQAAPTERIIKLVNNVTTTAVRAEVEMKGKIQMRPKLFVVTSNVKDLGAPIYSNEPVSILRRFPLIINCRVKPEYTIEGTTMLDPLKVPPVMIPDVWDFDVEYCVGTDPLAGAARKAQEITYRPYVFEGKEAKNLNIFELRELCCKHYKTHSDTQKRLVRKAEGMYDALQICSQCYRAPESCHCSMDPQAFTSGEHVIDRAQYLYDHGMRYLHSTRIRTNKVWFMYRLFCKRRYLFQTLRWPCLTVLSYMIVMFLQIDYNNWLPYLFTLMYLLSCLYVRINEEFNEALRCTIALPNLGRLLQGRQLHRLQQVMLGTTFCGIVYAFCKLYKGWKEFSTQGNLVPTSQAEVDQRDKEESDWAKVVTRPLPTSAPMRTTTSEQLIGIISKNLCYVENVATGKFMNILFLRSGLALIPYHIFPEGGEEEIVCTFIRGDRKQLGSTFHARISKTYTRQLANTDTAVTYISGAPDFMDLSAYLFPTSVKANTECQFLRRLSCGATDVCVVGSQIVDNTYRYATAYDTYEGLCGAVLLSDSRAKGIMGIHIAGVLRSKAAKASIITKELVDNAWRELSKVKGVVPMANQADMSDTVYDMKFLDSDKVHPKSPVNFLPVGSNVQVYGSCIGMSTSVSEVTDTVISADVNAVTSVPNTYGPPKFKGPNNEGTWWPYREALLKCSVTSQGVPGNLLEKSYRDYIEPLLDIAANPKMEWVTTKPLTELENISGRDGVKFITALEANTSVGYPLTGAKSKFMVDLTDEESLSTHQCPRALDRRFWEEAYRIEELYAQNKRAYPVFKACLKDEVKSKTSNKVRVFQSAPVALQLMIRKYYLPVARLLSVNPIRSECAVGVNAIGPEWQQLTSKIRKYGKKNILAGDYSSYDLTMSPQLMFAAFGIMIDLATKMNYSERDLIVMRTMASDICHPMVAYQGTLIELLGSNPSGHNLTVYINSIVNSLLMRCAYFHILGLDAGSFRDFVSLITYGDDVKSSVKDSIKDKFNHITYAAFLKDVVGMGFTMPNKTDVPIPLMEDEAADFLKRKNVYLPELGHYVGALDQDSIFKSLHCTMTSSALTPRQQAAQNIDNSLREWYYHGRTVYEGRLAQMREVAKRANLVHLCNCLDFPYDYWTVKWFEKYQPLPDGESRPLPRLELEWREQGDAHIASEETYK